MAEKSPHGLQRCDSFQQKLEQVGAYAITARVRSLGVPGKKRRRKQRTRYPRITGDAVQRKSGFAVVGGKKTRHQRNRVKGPFKTWLGPVQL